MFKALNPTALRRASRSRQIGTVNSVPYALKRMALLGLGGAFGGLAGIAVSAGRPLAARSKPDRLVRPGAAAVGDPARRGNCGPPSAARVSARLSLWCALVRGQLLLDLRHHENPRRSAALRVGADAGGVQPGAGTVLRTIRAECGACAKEFQRRVGAGCGAVSLGRA